MGKPKLIIAENIQEELFQQIKKAAPEWEIIFDKDPEAWRPHLQSADVIAGWKKEMEEPCLDKDSRLSWIQSWSAGIDNYPLDKLAAKNIHLTSANGVHAYPISETIFALMLAWTRKIDTYVRNQSKKVWEHANLRLEIHNKTIGIVGMGAIGKETAKIAKAFNMKVIGVRNSEKKEPFVDQMVKTGQLNEVLPSCDYVVITLPLTSATYHLFQEEQFQLMKPSSFLVNIGRGKIIDEKALIQALKKGDIAGAGLDVFETEPLEPNNPLWEMENVIIAPHSAGSTEFYDQRVVEDIFLPNLQHFQKGKAPSINLVDYQKEY